MNSKKMAPLIAAYALVALGFFGYAFNNQPPTKHAWGVEVPTNDADRFVVGALSGLFWPMYMSVQVFKKEAHHGK